MGSLYCKGKIVMKSRKAAVIMLTAIVLSSCSSIKKQDSLPDNYTATVTTTVQTRNEKTVENTESEQREMPTYTHISDSDYIDFGSLIDRDMIVDNTLHSEQQGDIHFSLYIPESYDGSKPYALFVTLPGWEGLYFQGVGANLGESFPFEARQYNEQMIIISAQLDDWGETSANMEITLTEYFLANYNIDTNKVYLHGYSGGGETGSIVMCRSPELYTAYLMTSSQWDGDYSVLAKAQTPAYLAVGEEDSYYGSEPMKNAYAELHRLYKEQGLSDEEIDNLLVLDVKDQKYFDERGYSDQHGGGNTFGQDSEIMGWLFGEH